MNFTIPQFIEMESKVVGPLTFKQFGFVGTGGAVSLLIYFSVGKTAMSFALMLITLVMGAACSVAFVKVNGIPIATVMVHLFNFTRAPKIFLWKNFNLPKAIVTTQEVITIKKAPVVKEVDLVLGKSSLKQMRLYMETA